MRVRDAVEEYRMAKKKLPKKTLGFYMQKLGVFVVWCEKQELEIEDIKISHVRRFLDHLQTVPSERTHNLLGSHTMNGYARVLKMFLKWCGREEELSELVSSRLSERVDVPKIDQKVIEIFTPQHIKSLYKACEREHTEALRMRDIAILSILLSTGIRASELIGLRIEDIRIGRDDSYIKVFGKGRKEREVGLEDRARKDVMRYINRYRPKSDLPNVFLTRYHQAFTLTGFDKVFERLESWGNITGVRCTPHTCRHTFAINYLKNGGDVFKLSRLLGHSSVSITEIYLRAFKQSDARKGGPSMLDDL